jgi:hypothetical protein
MRDAEGKGQRAATELRTGIKLELWMQSSQDAVGKWPETLGVSERERAKSELDRNPSLNGWVEE